MAKIPEELLKNAQKIQQTMDSLKNRLGYITVTGQAGGGMVEIEMNAKQELIGVRIEPEAVGDIEVLQDLILAAYNSAIEKVKDALNDQVGSYTDLIKDLLPDDLKF
ncbi:MAG: YbaB/EbfC family nucleoid-associated protein [Spirochaetaceae bacterium]|jgi:DNA-binding YbaB/EbfC family protein|nr:YbaB/EbfC family nucleoid-associated protein [Spirochaetaceae bacterium]